MEEEMPVAAPRDAVGAAGAAVGTKGQCETNMLEEGEERAAENEVGDGREVWRDVLKFESVPALRKIFARSPTKVVQWLLEEELERGETAAAAAAAGGEGGGGVGDNEREGRQTVLHLCAMKGETDMMQTILELVSGNCGSSSSSSSSSGGDERRKTRGGGEEGKEGETGIQRLHGVLSKRNAQGRTPLYLAAQNGHDKCVAMLLSLSSSLPPSPPSFSFPPAASSPTAPPPPQIVAAAAAAAVAAGAEASTTTTIPSLRPSLHALPDHHGTTPLLIATKRGHTAVVRLLLQAYREEGKEEGVDAPDAMGRTAFFEACRFGREEVMSLPPSLPPPPPSRHQSHPWFGPYSHPLPLPPSLPLSLPRSFHCSSKQGRVLF